MRYVDADGVTRFIGRWRGVVTSVDDPNKQGRVRALVEGVYGSTESPWIRPSLMPDDFRVPDLGTQVWVEFEQGNPDFPIWSGYLPSSAEGAKAAAPTMIGLDDDTTAAGLGKGGGAVPLIGIDGQEYTIVEPVTSAKPVYPNVRAMRIGKNFIEVDGTPGAERVQIYHQSGAYYEIGSTGQVKELARGSRSDWVKGSRTVITTGAKTESVGGAARSDFKKGRFVTVKGNDTYQLTGNRVRTVSGSATESIDGALTLDIGGLRKVSMAGDDYKNLGNRNTLVGGNDTRLVVGADVATIGNKDFAAGQTVGYSRTIVAGDAEIALTVGTYKLTTAAGALSVGTDGSFTLQNAVGKWTMDAAGRMAFAGATGELLTLFDDLLTALISSVTTTALGPQPLSGVAQFTTIKGLLAGIKE